MNKKAFEIQFNWIFVLIAGAAILAFFIAIVAKQKSVSETSTKAVVLKNVEAMITGSGVSTDTIALKQIPNSEIDVKCNSVSLGAISKTYQNLILFAPSMIKGDKLVTQTITFSVPYRATNLLFMTSPKLRYIVIGSSELANEIYKLLPSDLSKEFYQSAPQIKNDNNYKVRFIFFGDIGIFPQSLKKMDDMDVSALKVSEDINQRTIEFFQKNGDSWISKGTSVYVGKESLIGAVYSDTLEAYECNMGNVFKRLNLVTRVLLVRTGKLYDNSFVSGRNTQCTPFYQNAKEKLDAINSASSRFSPENVNAIIEAAKALTNENRNVQTYSCPLIY